MAKEAVKKPAETAKKPALQPASHLFEADNIRWMIIGGVVIILGLLLMAGGKSKDPNIFNPSEIYSFRRVTIAPLLVVGGLVVEIFAIMKKPKAKA
jgi:hypothetical protein